MSQDFWSQLKTFLGSVNINLWLDYKTICFGTDGAKKSETLINFIIISAKHFIFKCKYLKIVPNITFYKIFLKKRMEIEKCIAFEKDKIEQHTLKWQKLIPVNL